ncbi:MAG TPA: protein kinase [Vicinamibacterales bacterium]|nr:protein kinase [Vicinamibacterales bacterium]
MTPERWQAIGDLFERALPLSAGARTALLDEACGVDADLRREVASLLASHHAGGGFVQRRIENALVSFHATSVADAQPARVGPYRLIRELGRGGMGTVFLAERDDEQYHARVAVKLVRPGMDTEFILARFRRERQTLARLHHPNISRLLDGGTTETGLPYFVMEYIDGPWLTVYADGQRLNVEARVRLLLDVCSAVDYAHRNFIIHRDLKPGNILVDAGGIPKLLDFGICKLLRTDAVATDETVATPMTPNYASPEQIRGEPVTALSDIYSLGAVLYELLTGRCPRHFALLTPAAFDRMLRTPITLPSAASLDRATARQLRGDLDHILIRALETEPHRRYESAAQFAQDLRRHLDDEPVHARSQTLRYRASKFAWRNRVPLAAAAAVFLALSVGFAASVYEARIAGLRLQQIRSIADRLVFDVHDAVRDLPGSTKARQIIVKTGLEYLDATFKSVQGDANAEKELAKAYRRLGDVQGNVQAANLGDPTGAAVSYRRAIPLLDDAIRRVPGDLDAVTERLVLFDRIGTLQAYTGRLRDAVQTLQDGIRAGTPLVGSGNPDLAAALAGLYLASSEAVRNMNNNPEALRDASESLRLFQAVAARRASDPAARFPVAAALAAVGMAEAGLNQLNDALAHFRQGTAELEPLVASHPTNVSWNRDLMLAYGHVADVLGNPGLHNLGDRAGALRAYRQAAEIGKRLYDADPADHRAVSDYGIVLSRVETMMDDSDVAAKRAVQQESIRVLEGAAKISPGDVSPKIYLTLLNQHLGDSFTTTGDLEAARTAYRKSADIAGAGRGSGHSALHIMFIQTNQRLALNAVARGQRDEALDFARRALQAGENPPPGSGPLRAMPRGLSAMALTYAALARSGVRLSGDRDAALMWINKSLDAWHASQAEPGFGEPHQREMHDVELALTRLQSGVIDSATVSRTIR